MLPSRVNLESVRDSIGEYADTRESFDARADIYKDLLGFLPPRIEARFAVTGALDPTILDLQEKLRKHGMYPKSFDVKTAQLMLFGMLLMDSSDAAPLHAIAARRAGASWAELQDTVNLCFLFRGMSAANRGAEVLANIAHRERVEAAQATQAAQVDSAADAAS
ncbi:carboxymuconolactone decarboxylase family protein [Paraburkholderia sp. ZP32-5]|uniref:carboxymuconolactone decarboxylase family protein n=1 Tax=Paraburkholderia sp. ZP32-5 TaxID=2883245 RepID=UPI001F2000CF|nr:carboxymuconolactone decarboxylase family protein [Paraburkholderia sp. ZP32-5]